MNMLLAILKRCLISKIEIHDQSRKLLKNKSTFAVSTMAVYDLAAIPKRWGISRYSADDYH